MKGQSILHVYSCIDPNSLQICQTQLEHVDVVIILKWNLRIYVTDEKFIRMFANATKHN